MKTFTSYRLHITPLSPVHIGTGDSYEPTQYVIEDEILHEFDTGAAMAAFSSGDREALLRIANGKPNADMLKALQGFFFERREALKAWAVNAIPVLPGVARLYAERVGQTANREADGKQVLNRLEIDRTGYAPVTRRPVLFGSSLKGAIRTALLNHANQENPLPARDAELFALEGLPDFQQKERRREQRRIFPRLNERLLRFQAGKFERDPLRLVQLSDAVWREQDDFPTAQVLLAVNRKKELVRDKHGNEILSQAQRAGLYQILECVPQWRYRSFSALLNLQRLGTLRDDPDRRKLPLPELRFDVENIAERCSNFYIPILKGEIKHLRDRGFLDAEWEKCVERILAIAAESLNQGKAFVLRVGRHSGAESITLNGARHIKILKGTPEFQPQAKTLWLAASEKDQNRNLLPFGWLLVEIQPLDSPDTDWPELRNLCEPHLASARRFAAKLAEQRERLAETRAKAEAQRQEEEKRAREIAEQEAQAAREAAQKQAELAALSDEGRRAEALESALTAANRGKGKGHQLFRAVTELIAQAGSWSPDDKARLKDKAAKAFAHLGLKKDDYKKLLRSLD